jgi:DNA-binding CsgD family transcriptional regulator
MRMTRSARNSLARNPLRAPPNISRVIARTESVSKTQRSQPLSWTSVSSPDRGSAGFLLTDLNFEPIYTNAAAVAILIFPDPAQRPANQAALVERIRTILTADRFTPAMPAADFISGKRAYVCRPYLLDPRAGRRPPMVVLLLERQVRKPMALLEVSRLFHFSHRECETVQHLVQGLTTKEVAQRMNVSPNTVKQFIRFIMGKTGVTTRAGIVGKLVGG